MILEFRCVKSHFERKKNRKIMKTAQFIRVWYVLNLQDRPSLVIGVRVKSLPITDVDENVRLQLKSR